jgi:hypothetical protein
MLAFEGSQDGSFLAMDLPLEEESCKNITIQLYPSPEKHDKNLVRVKQEGGGSNRRGAISLRIFTLDQPKCDRTGKKWLVLICIHPPRSWTD